MTTNNFDKFMDDIVIHEQKTKPLKNEKSNDSPNRQYIKKYQGDAKGKIKFSKKNK